MIDGFHEKLITQFCEEEDRFIFEQLKPYCEHITQMAITKHDLETALLKSKPTLVQTVLDDDNFPKEFHCPRCA